MSTMSSLRRRRASSDERMSSASFASPVSASSFAARRTTWRSDGPVNSHAKETRAAASAPPCSTRVSARTAAEGAPVDRCAFAAASMPPRVSSAAASSRRISERRSSVGKSLAAAKALASRMSPPILRMSMAPRTSCMDNFSIAARWNSLAATSLSHCASATVDHTA